MAAKRKRAKKPGPGRGMVRPNKVLKLPAFRKPRFLNATKQDVTGVSVTAYSSGDPIPPSANPPNGIVPSGGEVEAESYPPDAQPTQIRVTATSVVGTVTRTLNWMEPQVALTGGFFIAAVVVIFDKDVFAQIIYTKGRGDNGTSDSVVVVPKALT